MSTFSTTKSIESLVKSILLQDASSSSVSLSDFLGRIVHSPNASIRQYAKSVIFRVIRDQLGRINIERAERLCRELETEFTDDDKIEALMTDLMVEQDRRRSNDHRRFDSTPRARQDVMKRKPPPVVPASATFITTPMWTPKPLVRLPFTPGRRDLLSSSSSSPSSDEDRRTHQKTTTTPITKPGPIRGSGRSPMLEPRHLEKMNKFRLARAVARWREVVRRRQWGEQGAERLVRVMSVLMKRLAFSELQSFVKEAGLSAAAMEELAVGVRVEKLRRLQGEMYDRWRKRFLHTIDMRRKQVSGVKRLIRAVSVRPHLALSSALSSLADFAFQGRLELGAKILRRFALKRIANWLSELESRASFGRVLGELHRIRAGKAIAILERVLGGCLREVGKSVFVELGLVSFTHRMKTKRKCEWIQRWIEETRNRERQRRGFCCLEKVETSMCRRMVILKLQRIPYVANSNLRTKLALSRIVRLCEGRSVRVGFQALSRRVTEGRKMKTLVQTVAVATMRPVWRALLVHSTADRASRAVSLLNLSCVHRIDTLRNAFHQLRLHTYCNALSSQCDVLTHSLHEAVAESDSLRQGVSTTIHTQGCLELELKQAVTEVQQWEDRVVDQIVERKVWRQWVLTVRRRKQLVAVIAMLQRRVSRDASWGLGTLRDNAIAGKVKKVAVTQLVSLVAGKVGSESIKPALAELHRFAQLFDPTLAANIVNRVALSCTRRAFSQWTLERRRNTLLARLVLKLTTVVTSGGFRALQQHSHRFEVIDALDHCDQWQLHVEQKVSVAASVVSRLFESSAKALLAHALVEWRAVVVRKKRAVAKVGSILQKCVARFVFGEFTRAASAVRVSHKLQIGISQISFVVKTVNARSLWCALMELRACQFERTVLAMERVTRSELSAQDGVMKQLESAAKELETDYTALAHKARNLTERNDLLENEVTVLRSKFEHQSHESEMLLLKLNEMRSVEGRYRERMDELNAEVNALKNVESQNQTLKETVEHQQEELLVMERKLADLAKLTQSVQFYRSKISLQSEQIASLQGKLRESTTDTHTSPLDSPIGEDVLYSSPINTRSQDLTYASSSLRGLQQAVDRSNMLRTSRRISADMSQISGDSTRRRRESLQRR